MNTKVSPLVSNGITALVTAILAAGATFGAISLSSGESISFAADNTSSIGSQSSRASSVYSANAYMGYGSSTHFKIGDSGSTLDGVYSATTTVDVSSIPGYQSTSTNITVTGASVGDGVYVSMVSGDLFSTTSSFAFSSWVSATDTVKLVLFNASGTAMDAGSSIIRAVVVSPLVP